MVAAAAAILFAASCQKAKEQPELDFSKALYTIFAKGTAQVTVMTNEVAEQELTIPLKFSGTAEKDVDYKVSAESVKIKAGQISGSITVTNISLSEEKTLTVSIEAPSGYKIGNRFSAVIAADKQEAIIFNFLSKENVVLESYKAVISFTGAESGKDFKAQTDLSIPIEVKGAGKSALTYNSTIEVKAGENKGYIKFSLKDPAFSGNLPVTVNINTIEAPRFIAGDNPEMLLNVRGKQTPDKLAGTWKFVRTMGLKDLNEWYTEYEDNTDILPTKNEGFTLTFTKNSDGSVKLVPGEKGDFANYFAESVVTLTKPVNPCAKAVTLGENTAEENNGFVSLDEEGSPYFVYTYYNLSNVNYAFSSTDKDYKPAAIAIAIIPSGKMVIQLKQYTMTPPFGENLFMMYEGVFDPDLMGFGSLFEKQ